MTAVRMVLVPGSKDQPLLRCSRWREFHQQGARAMFYNVAEGPTFVKTRPTLRRWSCQSHDGGSNGASPGSKNQPLLRYSRWREFHQQGARAMFYNVAEGPTF